MIVAKRSEVVENGQKYNLSGQAMKVCLVVPCMYNVNTKTQVSTCNIFPL